MYTIGYYVNNHGIGHFNRLFCLDRELQLSNIKYVLYVFTENKKRFESFNFSQNVKLVELPNPNWTNCTKSKAYHRLPTNCSDYFKPIVNSCIENNISIFVSDLSVEVGMAVRLLVDKLIYIVLHGDRSDITHQIMFHEADRLIIPFSKLLEDDHLLNLRLSFDTCYSEGFLKFQYEDISQFYFPPEYEIGKKNILVILGTGGDSFNKDYLVNKNPNYNIVVLGKKIKGLKSVKFTNPYSYLKYADVVVGNAGDSLVHEISYFNKPYICIPEDRPHNEQLYKAEVLLSGGFTYNSNWKSTIDKDVEYVINNTQRDKTLLINKEGARQYANQILY
jgi:hypothetical protein